MESKPDNGSIKASSITTQQYVPVFLSSTYLDLQEYRKAVWSKLETLTVSIHGMELFGARPEQPIETSLKEVSKCDYYICVLGTRYGSIEEVSQKSFTELEYDKALEESKAILLYVIDDEQARVPPKWVDKGIDAERLADFKERAGKRHTVDHFTSPSDLSAKIERDLLRLFDEQNVDIDSTTLGSTESPDKALETLKKFHLIPGQVAGATIELTLNIKSDIQSLNTEQCKALRLTYGKAIKREIEIMAPEINSKKWTWAKWIFAEEERAEELIKFSEGMTIKVEARLGFGEEKDRIFHLSPQRYDLGNVSTATFFMQEWDTELADLDTGQTHRNYYYSRTTALKAIIYVRQLKAKQR